MHEKVVDIHNSNDTILLVIDGPLIRATLCSSLTGIGGPILLDSVVESVSQTEDVKFGRYLILD